MSLENGKIFTVILFSKQEDKQTFDSAQNKSQKKFPTSKGEPKIWTVEVV